MPERRASKGGAELGIAWRASSWLSRGLMQLRKTQLAPDHPRPCCHVDASHKVYAHGFYQRLANYLSALVAVHRDVRRWLCVTCGRTFSVLPADVLPYRQVSVSAVEKHFDAQANEATPPAATVLTEGCLKRAWLRFTLRLTALTASLGQLMQREDLADAKRFWQGLRRWGNLEEILRVLSADFQTSLLQDYLCLRPWPAP